MITVDYGAAELVVCVDGPKAGQWFFRPDWDALVESSRNMADRGQAPSTSLGYVVGTGTVPHPSANAVGTPLYYRPGGAA